MKKSNFILKLVLFAFIINLSSPLLAEESETKSKTVEEEEIPQSLKDLRRFEIITLGALPFVVLDSTLVYSGIKYIQNDFSSQYKPGFNQKFSKDEQLGIVLTSIGISIGIGITDLIVNLVKRNKKKKNQELMENNSILIMPIAQDPDAIKLDKPATKDDENKKSTEITEEKK